VLAVFVSAEVFRWGEMWVGVGVCVIYRGVCVGWWGRFVGGGWWNEGFILGRGEGELEQGRVRTRCLLGR